MPFSVFLTWIITHLFAFICGLWLYLRYRKNKNERVGYFAKYLLFGTIGMWILVITIYYTKFMPPYGPWGFLIGAATKTIGLIFLIRLLFSFIWPKMEKAAMFSAILVTIVFVGFGIKMVLTGTAVPLSIRWIAMVFFSAMIAFPSLWMIIQALKSAERAIKLRGLLIGIGLFLFGVSVSGCGAAALVPPFFQNMIVALATLVFFLGILYTCKKEKPEVILPPVQAQFASAVGEPKVQW